MNEDQEIFILTYVDYDCYKEATLRHGILGSFLSKDKAISYLKSYVKEHDLAVNYVNLTEYKLTDASVVAAATDIFASYRVFFYLTKTKLGEGGDHEII